MRHNRKITRHSRSSGTYLIRSSKRKRTFRSKAMVLLKKPSVFNTFENMQINLCIDKADAEQVMQMLENLCVGVDYDLTIRKKGKRSINANNYHWLLCERIAKVLRISKYEAHNQLMIHYGTDWRDSKGDRHFVLMKDSDMYLRSTTVHYRPTDKVEERKGKLYRWFVLLLPSHLMNTQEMSELIDGTVSEAKELGIEVRTPDEIERMKALWGTQAS